jgi:uncharacterized protein (TIGR02284 family)
LKSVVTSGDPPAILAECEAGENAALTAYDEARHKGLPGDVHAVVDGQYQAIKAARDRLRALIAENREKTAYEEV